MLSGGRIGRQRARVGWEELALGAIASVWGFRLELAVLALGFAVERVTARAVGEAGAVMLVVLAAGAVAVAPTRGVLWRWFRAASVRRAWTRAAVDTGLSDGPLLVPRIMGTAHIPAGEVLRVRIRRGQSVADFEARADVLAASLRARDVRVVREPDDAAEASVIVVRRDPFEGVSPLRWPLLDAEELSVWAAAPLGVDEQGDSVSLLLPERNVLVGGEPGAGKSAALSVIVAMAALDPCARLWLLDGKLVELAAWAPACRRLAGTDGRDAIGLLREVQAEMDARYRELLARGLRKIGPDEGLPLDVVVCDELAFYLSLPDKRERQEFTELLRDLVARGRAAGVIVCAATQKPGSDVVPTALRDLFGFRLALRCNTPQASDTILGQGWASAGADASKIPGGQRGVGYLLTEGERPVPIKGFYLTDDDVRAIAERAAAKRAEAWSTETVTAQHSADGSSSGR
jgi:hypothetical protein